jgi:hypothetical protein
MCWGYDMTLPPSVRGGANGVEAHYDDMAAAARVFGAAAGDTAQAMLALHGYLVHPAIFAAAVLDPAGAADFEVRLVGALDGPSGVTWLATRCAGVDVALRAAAAAYLGADRLEERVAPVLGGLVHAPKAVGEATQALARGQPNEAWQELLTDDPELADLAVRATGTLLGAGSVTASFRLVGGLLGDGSARVTDLGEDPMADATGPPRGVRDVTAGLARRNLGRPGEIDVRLLDGADGRRRVIVDVPGTKDWSLALHNHDVTSLATNLRAISGEVTTYERGIVEAMRRAGVQPDNEVLLVGHSEGGLVAVDAAKHLASTGEFRVTHVVTAGAPIALVAGGIPSSIDVLAIENEGDLVPHLDGAENPDRVNVTSVTTRHDHGNVLANHDLDGSYVAGSADVDASDEPSVQAYVGGLSSFLTARSVHTRRYIITRRYP